MLPSQLWQDSCRDPPGGFPWWNTRTTAISHREAPSSTSRQVTVIPFYDIISQEGSRKTRESRSSSDDSLALPHASGFDRNHQLRQLRCRLREIDPLLIAGGSDRYHPARSVSPPMTVRNQHPQRVVHGRNQTEDRALGSTVSASFSAGIVTAHGGFSAEVLSARE